MNFTIDAYSFNNRQSLSKESVSPKNLIIDLEMISQLTAKATRMKGKVAGK